MSTFLAGPVIVPFRKIEVQDNDWLWPGRIPLGAITTLIGYGGEGKSFLACSIACAVSRGGPLPDGTSAPQGAVVVMAGEDLPSKLRLRYEANGADIDQLTLLKGQRIYTKQGPAEIAITLRDIDHIRTAIDESAAQAAQLRSGQSQAVKLLIIDPVGDFIPGINSDKDNEVRSLLNPLAELAQDRNLAVLLICHRKKGAGDRADNAALGSVAFTSKARAVHHVILDPYDTANPSQRRRLFLPGKLNDQEQAQGLAFRIVNSNPSGSPSGAAPTSGKARSTGIVEWEEAPVEHTADAVMAYASAKSKAERAADPHSLREAEVWLRESLKEGARPARDLTAAARAEGIAPRTLRRAKQTLGVTHDRVSRQGAFIWQLPMGAATTSSPTPTPESQPPESPPPTLPVPATENWYWPM